MRQSLHADTENRDRGLRVVRKSSITYPNSTSSLGRVKGKLSGASLDPEDLWMWMEEQVAPFESQLLY